MNLGPARSIAPDMPRTGRRLHGLLLALAMLLPLCVTGPASAHARLVKSKPAADAQLSASPRAIRLWFNESPELDFSSIRVQDAGGNDVVAGELVRTRQPNGLSLKVPTPLPAGPYRVRYRVLSVDGHIVEGEFSFRIDAAPAAKGS